MAQFPVSKLSASTSKISGKGVAPFIQAINPLLPMVDLVGKILQHKQALAMMDYQMQRVRGEMQLRLADIERAREMALAEIELRRQEGLRRLAMSADTLQHMALERSQIIQQMGNFSQLVVSGRLAHQAVVLALTTYQGLADQLLAMRGQELNHLETMMGRPALTKE